MYRQDIFATRPLVAIFRSLHRKMFVSFRNKDDNVAYGNPVFDGAEDNVTIM